MREEIKKELVWRYKFLYENIEYIMLPFMRYSNLMDDKDFIINRRIPYELLNLGQMFLLDDGKAEFSEFVKYIERRKKEPEYEQKIKAKQFEIKDKERLIREFLNSICDLMMIQERNGIAKVKKLKVMDEYYKILNYKNKSDAQVCGSKLIARKLKSERRNLGDYWLKRKEAENLIISNFIKYVSDKKNYNLDSLSILTDKERQEIYLAFHEEIAWDTKVVCAVDKNTLYKPQKKHLLRQDINPPCGEEFYIEENKLFINPKDTCYDYYQSCPNCGYVVNIPHDILPNDVKTRIEDRYLRDEYEFSARLLSAELRSIDYRDDILIKRRTK